MISDGGAKNNIKKLQIKYDIIKYLTIRRHQLLFQVSPWISCTIFCDLPMHHVDILVHSSEQFGIGNKHEHSELSHS